MKITTNEWTNTKAFQVDRLRWPPKVNSCTGDAGIPTLNQQAMGCFAVSLFPTGTRFQKGLSGRPKKGWLEGNQLSGMFSHWFNVVWKQFLELQKVNQDTHYFILPWNNRPEQPTPGTSPETVFAHVRKQSRVFKTPAVTAFVSLQRIWITLRKWLHRKMVSPEIQNSAGIPQRGLSYMLSHKSSLSSRGYDLFYLRASQTFHSYEAPFLILSHI